MRILDWRPRTERVLTSLWPRRDARGPRVSPAGRVWNGLHDRLVARRVAGRSATGGAPPVVSIGNLALGGTGKTPIVLALAQGLAELGHTGCVLTRGFRSPLAGPLFVEADNGLAGDEARLLAASLPTDGWQVVQARHRSSGLRHILAGPGCPHVILLEDGHQTAGVVRALDVLILDHWQVQAGPSGAEVVPQTGTVFPFGPWRESAAGAARAGVWLLETATDVPSGGRGGAAVLSFTRSHRCSPVNGTAGGPEGPRAAALVSGIARPEKFEAGAVALLGSPAPLAVRLADHQTYGPRLVQRLQQEMAAADCRALVTTAKDWIKMAPFWPTSLPAYVVDQTVNWGGAQTLPELVGEHLQSAR